MNTTEMIEFLAGLSNANLNLFKFSYTKRYRCKFDCEHSGVKLEIDKEAESPEEAVTLVYEAYRKATSDGLPNYSAPQLEYQTLDEINDNDELL